MPEPTRRRRWSVTLVVALVAVGLRVGAAPAERCPAITAADARSAAEDAVGWFAATQHDDGRFLYLSDESGRDLGGYNVVRHAGVLMSLEAAVDAGIGAAQPVADRGLAWAMDHLRRAGGGRALSDDGRTATGATALLARALLARDDTDPLLLRELGTFLAGQVDGDGAVLAEWKPGVGATGEPNAFFTGEAYWALLGLGGFDDATDRIGRYLPGRDDAEDVFPPLADHWAAYSYAVVGFDDLTPEQRAHADRMAGLFGTQVRGEATRWEGGLQGALRGGPAMGSGLGTLGEGAGNLLILYGDEAPSGLDRRVRCVAGMLVARQAPDGAWYADGETRMDDQQHALSALLLSAPVLGASASDAVGGGEQSHSFLWLLALAMVVANPWLPRARSGGRALLGAAGALALVVLSGPILDALDLSPASVRAAAGIAAVVSALGVLAAPRSSEVAGLVGAACAAVALGVGADDGAAAVVPLLLAALLTAAAPSSWRRPTPARLAAVGLLVLAVDLIVDGILGV